MVVGGGSTAENEAIRNNGRRKAFVLKPFGIDDHQLFKINLLLFLLCSYLAEDQ